MTTNLKVMKYCKFHFSEKKICKFGRKCKFVHDRNILIPCAHFLEGEKECAHGADCWYLHVVTEESIENLKDDQMKFQTAMKKQMSKLHSENLEMKKSLDECGNHQRMLQEEITMKSNEIKKLQQSFDSLLNTTNGKEEDGPNSSEEVSQEVSEEVFEVGQWVKIVEPNELISAFSSHTTNRPWVEGVVRNVNEDGTYDIQTDAYSFWEVPSRKVKTLESKLMEERLKSINRYMRLTKEDYWNELMKKRMKK